MQRNKALLADFRVIGLLRRPINIQDFAADQTLNYFILAHRSHVLSTWANQEPSYELEMFFITRLSSKQGNCNFCTR